MKQVEVTIMGQGYVLGCPEGGEALLDLAVSQVDREMSAIRNSGKVKARERIAVLAALNVAYQLAEQRRDGTPAAPTSAMTQADGATLDLEGLIHRIDQVLDSDGHLL